MKTNPLSERGYALEEVYCSKLQTQQLARIREESRREELLRTLGAELAIDDSRFLDSLIELGITADTAAAFEALPLVEVAWADGEIDSQERWRVLALATAFGLELGRPAHAQLELWLRQKPEEELFEAWYEFAAIGLAGPGPAARVRRVPEGALEVANASGGLLGFWTISGSERAAIDRIRGALGEPRPSAEPN
jgi:tellurite resistance protein